MKFETYSDAGVLGPENPQRVTKVGVLSGTMALLQANWYVCSWFDGRPDERLCLVLGEGFRNLLLLESSAKGGPLRLMGSGERC